MTDPLWTPEVPCAIDLAHTCGGPTTPCPRLDGDATCLGAVYALAQMALTSLIAHNLTSDAEARACWQNDLAWCGAALKTYPLTLRASHTPNERT